MSIGISEHFSRFLYRQSYNGRLVSVSKNCNPIRSNRPGQCYRLQNKRKYWWKDTILQRFNQLVGSLEEGNIWLWAYILPSFITQWAAVRNMEGPIRAPPHNCPFLSDSSKNENTDDIAGNSENGHQQFVVFFIMKKLEQQWRDSFSILKVLR